MGGLKRYLFVCVYCCLKKIKLVEFTSFRFYRDEASSGILNKSVVIPERFQCFDTFIQETCTSSTKIANTIMIFIYCFVVNVVLILMNI